MLLLGFCRTRTFNAPSGPILDVEPTLEGVEPAG
jgi:hypothetical protein